MIIVCNVIGANLHPVNITIDTVFFPINLSKISQVMCNLGVIGIRDEKE
jgi:hypothetical protein